MNLKVNQDENGYSYTYGTTSNLNCWIWTVWTITMKRQLVTVRVCKNCNSSC